MLIDICLPVKNEEDLLEKSLSQIFLFLQQKSFLRHESKITWKISVVINGSNDNSWQICQEQVSKYKPLLNCQLVVEPGKGRAIKTAWANSSADILVFMDADLAVSLEAFDDLIKPILENKADLVIGSRFLKASSTKRSRQRGLISSGYLQLSRLLLNHKQTDLQCGFKAIRKDFFRKLEKFLTDDYWFFDTELLVFTSKLGGRIIEIPINWQEPRKNKQKSKIKIFQDSWQFFVKLIKLKQRLKHFKIY